MKGGSVQVRQRGYENGMPFVTHPRRDACLNRGDRSCFDREPDIRSPAVGGQGGIGMKGSQARLRAIAAFLRFNSFCIAINWKLRKRLAMGQPADEVETIWLN